VGFLHAASKRLRFLSLEQEEAMAQIKNLSLGRLDGATYAGGAKMLPVRGASTRRVRRWIV